MVNLPGECVSENAGSISNPQLFDIPPPMAIASPGKGSNSGQGIQHASPVVANNGSLPQVMMVHPHLQVIF